MRRRRNPGALQLQPIVGRPALRLRRESRPVQRPVKEVAGTVSCEHTSCTISAMRRGRKPHDQQTG